MSSASLSVTSNSCARLVRLHEKDGMRGGYLHRVPEYLTPAWNMLELESDVDCCLFAFSNSKELSDENARAG